jgi:polyprenyl P-hydroxybenzoate/phenylacrylic acid decarboxylase-like protein
MKSTATARPLVVGLTGASMPQMGIRLLEVLKDQGIETHLVISKGARRTIALEAPGWTVSDVQDLASFVHSPDDLAAPIASGSFRTRGMVVMPCSMNTLAAIAHSTSADLLTRTADVMLKEGRTLVLVPRESPLHLGHLRNLTAAAELGARIFPPILGAYYRPATIADVVDHLVGRILDQFDIEHDLVRRWTGPPVTERV